MIYSPFQPYLKEGTTTLAITASAQTMTPSPSGIPSSYLFSNIGTVAIYFIAYPAGAAVTAATVTTGIPMPPNTFKVFELPPNMSVSVIAGGTGSSLSITPGEGA